VRSVSLDNHSGGAPGEQISDAARGSHRPRVADTVLRGEPVNELERESNPPWRTVLLGRRTESGPREVDNHLPNQLIATARVFVSAAVWASRRADGVTWPWNAQDQLPGQRIPVWTCAEEWSNPPINASRSVAGGVWVRE